jgi:hypothetical protein
VAIMVREMPWRQLQRPTSMAFRNSRLPMGSGHFGECRIGWKLSGKSPV